jgi:hypothetical protein
MKSFYLFLLATLLLFSCNESVEKKTVYKPESYGNINNLQVVISNELWNSDVGEEIRNYLAAPTHGLPQDEPIFSMNQLPPSTFSGFARKNRIFLHVSIGEEVSVRIAHDAYARPQTGIIITAPSEEEIIALIIKESERVIGALKASEIKERQRRTSLSTMRTDSLRYRFGVDMKIPSAYHIAANSEDFFWIRKELKSGSTNIIVYEVPQELIGKETTIVGDIIKMRDSIGGALMPVEDEGRFQTEEAYAPYLFNSEIDGKFAYETKGTWDVKGQWMAGPFLNYAVLDEKNNRYLILEGFTYAPSMAKRDLQFELESILKSAKLE